MKKIIFVFLGLSLLFLSCNNKKKSDSSNTNNIKLLSEKDFDTTFNGKKISLYTLDSGKGVKMQITNFGGRIVSLWVPDKNGQYEDVVLGHPDIKEYIDYKGERCLGPIIGRFANRIAKGRFELNGKAYRIPVNDRGQALHGGPEGFDMKVWNVESVNKNSISLSYLSPDGEEGFPGNLKVNVKYTLTKDNTIKIEYKATTDRPTVVNLTNHTFYNLKGTGNGTILDNYLTIKADKYTPIDSVSIPTGKNLSVAGTPFDFRKGTLIGARINEKNTQLKNGKGYDHNWVVNKKGKGVEFIARLYEPKSGRVMEVYSDQPGLQFYSGNFLDGKVVGKYGKAHKYREAVALEAQKFPDSPNEPSFPSTILNPGEVYTQTTLYKFYAKN